MPSPVRGRLAVTTGGFAAAFAVLEVVALMAAYGAAAAPRPGIRLAASSAVAGGLLLNGITHLGQALVLRRYTLGVATALLLLPYTVALFRRLMSGGLLGRRGVLAALAGGAGITPPLPMLAHALGRRLRP